MTIERLVGDAPRGVGNGTKNSLGEGRAVSSIRGGRPPRRERSDAEGPDAADVRGRISGNIQRGGDGERRLMWIAAKHPTLRVTHREPRQKREKSGAERTHEHA